MTGPWKWCGGSGRLPTGAAWATRQGGPRRAAGRVAAVERRGWRRAVCRVAPPSSRALRVASDGLRPPLTLEPLRPSGRSRGQADGLPPQGCAPPTPTPTRQVSPVRFGLTVAASVCRLRGMPRSRCDAPRRRPRDACRDAATVGSQPRRSCRMRIHEVPQAEVLTR